MASETLQDIGEDVLVEFKNMLGAMSISATSHGQENPGNNRNTRFEQERFQLWAANLGLFESGDRSLDYRIRDSPTARGFTTSLLCDLRENLTDSMFLLYSSEEDNVSYCSGCTLVGTSRSFT